MSDPRDALFSTPEMARLFSAEAHIAHHEPPVQHVAVGEYRCHVPTDQILAAPTVEPHEGQDYGSVHTGPAQKRCGCGSLGRNGGARVLHHGQIQRMQGNRRVSVGAHIAQPAMVINVTVGEDDAAQIAPVEILAPVAALRGNARR